jgi:uncharacterized membrane protein
MIVNRRIELVQWLLIGFMFGLTAWAWTRVPDQLPVHWDIAGEVDRYGGKVEGLLLVPLISLGLYGLFRVLPRLDPGRANYPRFAGAYSAIRIAILAVMAVIQLALVATALGQPIDVTRVIVVAVGALFAVIGAALGRLRPNWFVGIRTPWTLSSLRSWDATHRLGGRVFMAVGVATVLVGLVRPEWGLWTMLLGLGVGIVATVAYSYRVWRDDPDRQPAIAATTDRPA